MVIYARIESLKAGLHYRIGDGKESPIYIVNDLDEAISISKPIRGEILVIKRASASQSEVNVALVPEENPSERIIGLIVMRRPRIVNGSPLFWADDGNKSVIIAEPGVVLIGDGDFGPHAVALYREGWQTISRSSPIESDEVIRI